MVQLEADPTWIANRAARKTRLADSEEKVRAEEAPILADLAVAGVKAASVYDFVGKRAAPSEAIPILVRHLGRAHSPNVREGIIRALGVPSARTAAFEILCVAYRAEPEPHLRFAIANALSAMSRFDELTELPGIEKFVALFDPNTES